MKPVNLDDIEKLQLADGISARIITTDTLTVAHVSLDAGAILPEHQHYQEQVVNVTAGELELTVDGQPYRLTPGKVLVLAPNVPHSGRAITDCRVIDVFHPIREDFRSSGFGGYSGTDK